MIQPSPPSRHRALWALGGVYAVAIAASTAPSILYRRYQLEWGFSSGMLTLVYGVYALAVIVALLLIGSASDGRGRRPFIVASLSLLALSMLLFLLASSLWWLFLARIAQGLGVGVGISAVGSMMLDLHPSGRVSAFVNQATSNLGIIVGALGAGALVDFAPWPARLTYLVLLVGFLVCVPVVLTLRETVAAPPAGRPVVRRPALPERRTEFWLLSLGSISTWAVGGFYMSLGPSVSAEVLGSGRYTVNGLALAILGAGGLLAQLLFYGWSFKREMVVGTVLLSVGVACLLWSLWPRSAWLYFGGSIIGSMGWGLTAVGSFRSIVALSNPVRRAEVVAATYVVSYLALSVPAVAAGYASDHFGQRPTMVVFGVVVALMSSVAALTAARMHDVSEEEPAAAPVELRAACG